MKDQCIINSHQEYVLFLYIYLANSDYNVHLKEIDMIISKMEVLFPTHDDPQRLFLNVKKKFDSLEEESVEEIINKNFQLFKKELTNIEKLMEDFYDIILSDGIIQDYEIEAYERIKKLITS